MTESFKKYILTKNLFTGKDKILLAVSGGVDSVVMAHLFYRCKFDFAIAHCNFQLRNDESYGDEFFVAALAKSMNVSFYISRFETKKYAAKNKISVQMAARDLRYDFFESVRKKNKFNFIATAHNANDNAETVLLNLTRGGGQNVYKGIPVKQNKIIRPLLFASRDEISAYAAENKLKWREDASNSSDDYLRNRIRHHVIPVLKEQNPSLEKTLLHHSEIANEQQLLFEEYITLLKKEIVTEKNGAVYLSIKTLKKYPGSTTILFELLRGFSFIKDVVMEIAAALKAQSGKEFFSSTHKLIKDREVLIITSLKKKEAGEKKITEAGNYKLKEGTLKVQKIKATVALATKIMEGKFGSHFAFLDAAKIKFPLTVRTWQKGDYFYPQGMKGKKLLSDYYTDKKFSIIKKEKQLLVCSKNKITWVVNERIDERFKIKNKTKHILRLQFLANDN